MSTRELQRQLIENLREWQKLENAQITLTGSVMEKTSSPVVAPSQRLCHSFHISGIPALK